MAPMIATNMSHILISLSLSAALSGALPDLARDALQKTADWWFHWLLASSVVVFLGVAFETWEATITLKRWWRLRRGKEVNEPNEKSWAIPASYLGLLLVIVGVFGEGAFEALVSNADTALREHDSEVLAQAMMNAGSAKVSADAAARDASRANASLDEAQKKTREVAKQADAMASRIQELNGQANALSPRAYVLDNTESDLLKKISTFPNQEFTAQVCGPLIPTDSEREEITDTWGSIVNLLYTGAKWDWKNRLDDWKGCLPQMHGITVWVNVDAPGNTMKAARALSEELTRVLPRQYPPVFEPASCDLGLPPIDEESPWVLVCRNNGSIAILVGSHPTPRSNATAKPSNPTKR